MRNTKIKASRLDFFVVSCSYDLEYPELCYYYCRLMAIALVSTYNRSMPCPPLAVPVDDRKRKRVVRVPGFTRVLVEPV